jgi:DNA-binding HxlR family transcriptional regulator
MIPTFTPSDSHHIGNTALSSGSCVIGQNLQIASQFANLRFMKKTATKLRSHCPVNFALEAIGDRWAMLILRDIVFRGKRNYGEFLKSEEGFSINILASRLTQLVEARILQLEEHEADGRKGVYSMTEKGLDLIPMLFEMVLWSAKHDSKSEARRIAPLVEAYQQGQSQDQPENNGTGPARRGDPGGISCMNGTADTTLSSACS